LLLCLVGPLLLLAKLPQHNSDMQQQQQQADSSSKQQQCQVVLC
jgi:hypothetical protein